MSARPTYGLVELLALVVAIVRPWLDAYLTEFTAPPADPTDAPKPVADPVTPAEAPLPGPQPFAEVPTAAPVIEQLGAVQVQQLPAEMPTVDVSGLYVRRGSGHKVRYFAWDGVETGHVYRRHVQPNGKATYKQVPPATYQHGQRGRNDP